jgi:hypothetical protein
VSVAKRNLAGRELKAATCEAGRNTQGKWEETAIRNPYSSSKGIPTSGYAAIVKKGMRYPYPSEECREDESENQGTDIKEQRVGQRYKKRSIAPIHYPKAKGMRICEFPKRILGIANSSILQRSLANDRLTASVTSFSLISIPKFVV